MPIDIKINIDFSPRQKKIVRAAVVTGAVIAALGIGIALAAPIDTTWIANTQPVSASALLSDMTELNRRTIATHGSVSYSVGATLYCGQTTTTFTGSMGGYGGAKQACQGVASGCATSTTAHMCTGEELIRSASSGVPPTTAGWFATGVYSTNSGSAVRDCVGWSSAGTGEYGAVWDPSLGPSGVAVCSTPQPILCCD